MSRQVDHDPIGQRLPVSAGTATARCQTNGLVYGLGSDTGQDLNVLNIERKDH
ncbi:hypothetical protein D3C81_2326760 [compost metagenome]